MPRLVVDTNILIAALLRGGGSARRVVQACLGGVYEPLMGAALLAEYEDVMGREELLRTSPLTLTERDEVLDAFLQRCRWVEVFFAWRPNLPDEGDNHLVELAVAGGAHAIVTRNLRDLRGGELRFEALQVLTPERCLEIYPCPL